MNSQRAEANYAGKRATWRPGKQSQRDRGGGVMMVFSRNGDKGKEDRHSCGQPMLAARGIEVR